MRRFILLVVVLILSFPIVAKQDKGKGAGGVRVDHASDMGVEKGKAWAGSKEKEAKEEKVKKEKKAKKEKKEKKAKKKK